MRVRFSDSEQWSSPVKPPSDSEQWSSPVKPPRSQNYVKPHDARTRVQLAKVPVTWARDEVHNKRLAGRASEALALPTFLRDLDA